MTRYPLDSNIISNAEKPQPLEVLLDWIAAQQDRDVFVASLTFTEIRRSILELPGGRKRNSLESWLTGEDGPQALFAGRILSFDESAA